MTYKSSALKSFLAAWMFALIPSAMMAQGIHFSQYFNAPMLVSPANAGLMSDKDFRVGANYRSQWGAIPVPFNSYSVQADCQVFRDRNQTNWLGLGVGAFSDKSGDGNLTQTRYEAYAAYHLDLGTKSMLSAGASVASVQRTVDFSKLTFDAQWDGFDFDATNPSNEKDIENRASYADVSAGVNYAIFPSEQLYVKASVSVAHINRPKESFLNQSNNLGMRPTLNLDALYQINRLIVVNPSIYYTRQKNSEELMFGTLVSLDVSPDAHQSNLILGLYDRYNDAFVGVAGYEWNGLRLMASYDYTMSNLAQYINHNGAFEVSLRYAGTYINEAKQRRRSYQCPRF